MGWIKDAITDALWGVVKGIFGAAGEYIVKPILNAIITLLIDPILDPLLQTVQKLMVYTPAPETNGARPNIFAPPQNEPWITIFGEWWLWIVPLGLAVLVVSYLVSEALSASSLTDDQAAREREVGLFVGLVAIPASRYVITLYLQFMHLLSLYVAPSGQAIDLAHLADKDVVSGALAVLIVVSLSLVVYLTTVLIHLVRIAGIVVLTAAAPILLGFYLGRFPVVGTYSKKLLRMLPALAFVSVLTALALRLMSVLVDSNGELVLFDPSTFGAPAAALLNAMFLLVPGLIGAWLPIQVLRSMQFAPTPSARGIQRSTGNAMTERATSEAQERVVDPAVERGKRELEKRTPIGRDTTESGAHVESEQGQQDIAETAGEIKAETGVATSQRQLEDELMEEYESGKSAEEARSTVRERAEAAAEGQNARLDEITQRAAARMAKDITEEVAPPWSQATTQAEIEERIRQGQDIQEAAQNTREKAWEARGGSPDEPDDSGGGPDSDGGGGGGGGTGSGGGGGGGGGGSPPPGGVPPSIGEEQVLTEADQPVSLPVPSSTESEAAGASEAGDAGDTDDSGPADSRFALSHGWGESPTADGTGTSTDQNTAVDAGPHDPASKSGQPHDQAPRSSHDAAGDPDAGLPFDEWAALDESERSDVEEPASSGVDESNPAGASRRTNQQHDTDQDNDQDHDHEQMFDTQQHAQTDDD